MKLKTFYFCFAILTFLVGITLDLILANEPKPAVEIIIPNLVEPAVSENSTKTVYPPQSSTVKPKHLAAIEILRFDPEFEMNETKLEDLSAEPIDLDLDLSHSIENQIIALHPYPNDSRDFKIEQQFETSMSVSNEGPHLDLTDWKHYTSEWKEIKRLEGNKFLTSNISELDYQRFPKVTSKEIYKAVLKSGGKRWADYSRSCKTATGGPCLVSVSRISFRIKAKENGKWNVIHKINVSIPMGC